MSYRKGYYGEYLVKEKLSNEFGIKNVIKIAISQQGVDYLVLKGKEVLKLVEVKSTKKQKWYPIKEKDIRQFDKIVDFANERNIPVEYWIKTGGSTEFEVLSSNGFFEKYLEENM